MVVSEVSIRTRLPLFFFHFLPSQNINIFESPSTTTSLNTSHSHSLLCTPHHIKSYTLSFIFTTTTTAKMRFSTIVLSLSVGASASVLTALDPGQSIAAMTQSADYASRSLEAALENAKARIDLRLHLSF